MDPVMLDELDRRLVHALQVDGRAPFSRIAAVLGSTNRTIARRYHRLRSSGVLRVVGLPKTQRLGRVDWFVRIRCTPESATQLASALAGRDGISWVGFSSGGTDITCITQTHGDFDHDPLWHTLARTQGITSISAQCLLRTLAGTGGWPGRTAALDRDQIEALRRPRIDSTDSSGSGMTNTDQRLFAELAKDGRATYPLLAEATRLSESAVRRRLEELRTHGLLDFVVDIDQRLFGYATEAVVWLTVAPAELTAVGEALSAHEEVAYAAATTGPANIVALTVCRNPDALYEYLTSRIGALRGVLQVETALIMGRTKRTGTLLMPRSR